MCDEETGEIRSTHVTDVWRTGRRPVFRVALDNGYTLTMTKDHRCLTESGWMTLEVATDLRLRADGGVTWRGDAPRFAVNGVSLHRDGEWLRQRREEGLSVSAMADLAGVSYHTIRKALKDHRLTFTTVERARLSGVSQRGQRRTFYGRPWSPARLEVVHRARSGAASNFWKGGITAERASIGAWTTSHAQGIHRANDYRCVLCGGTEALNAHHVDPVWHDPSRSRDLTNLTSLCRPCHARVHHNNLELTLLAAVRAGTDLREFWLTAPHRFPRHERKRLPRSTRLVRTFASVMRIDYVGEQETFDLAVSGPFKNFVANGLIVHNSVNEYSARYSILDREFYIPAPEHLASQASANRQGRGDVLPSDQARQVLDLLRDDATRLYEHYERLLGETAQGAVVPQGIGLARELARMDLTLNFYTQWYWKTDLHNLLHFLMLRADPHAQYEIRAYADALLDVVKQWTPLTHAAFVDYRLGAFELSAKALAVVRRLLEGEQVERDSSGMSPGEWRELMRELGRSKQAP
ncbi:MAG: FAD-dependent thymidylate synthase [Candidatus Limnocylindria bacterium]